MQSNENTYSQISTIYGPVCSWRLGLSLGVDLFFVNSICSFKCVYCQLGKINIHISERKVYIPTKQVMTDLNKSDLQKADVITFSGSGEPTLALNLGETIKQLNHSALGKCRDLINRNSIENCLIFFFSIRKERILKSCNEIA